MRPPPTYASSSDTALRCWRFPPLATLATHLNGAHSFTVHLARLSTVPSSLLPPLAWYLRSQHPPFSSLASLLVRAHSIIACDLAQSARNTNTSFHTLLDTSPDSRKTFQHPKPTHNRTTRSNAPLSTQAEDRLHHGRPNPAYPVPRPFFFSAHPT